MDWNLLNPTNDREKSLQLLDGKIASFLANPTPQNFQIVILMICMLPIFDKENSVKEEKIFYLFLYSKKFTNLNESSIKLLSECLNKMVRASKGYDSSYIVSHFGVIPNANIGFDYYNLNKRIEFLCLCMKRWKSTLKCDKRLLKSNETILMYHLGGATQCFYYFDNEIDDGNSILSPQEYYYYALTSKIVGIDFETISNDAINNISENDSLSIYYKGLIYKLRNNREEAIRCFEKSKDFQYSSILLSGNMNGLSSPKVKTINPEKDSSIVR